MGLSFSKWVPNEDSEMPCIINSMKLRAVEGQPIASIGPDSLTLSLLPRVQIEPALMCRRRRR